MHVNAPLARAVFGSIVIGLAMVPLAASAGGEIHRCIDGGRVTYTDRGGCEQGEVVAIASMTPVSTSGREDIAVYGRATPVSLGMSPRMVYDAMGRPLETIATLEGRLLVEYWVYRNADSTTRVAFQEGRVTRIHTR